MQPIHDSRGSAIVLARLHPSARVRSLRSLARAAGVDRIAVDILTAVGLRADGNGSAQVGQVTVAREAGVCDRTVRRRLAALADAGVFTRSRSGPRGTTRYALPLHVPAWTVDKAQLRALARAGAVVPADRAVGFAPPPPAPLFGWRRPDSCGVAKGRSPSGPADREGDTRPEKIAPIPAPPTAPRAPRRAVAGAPLLELRLSPADVAARALRAPGRTIAAGLSRRLRAPTDPAGYDPRTLTQAALPFLVGRSLIRSFLGQETARSEPPTEPRSDDAQPRTEPPEREPPD